MTGSTGLALYLVGRRGRSPRATAERPVPPRPAGSLAWLDVPHAGAARALPPLVQGLRREGLADTVLITCPTSVCNESPGTLSIQPPGERHRDIEDFLDHWRPDLGIVVSGALRPALIRAAQDRGVPLMLIEGVAPALAPGLRSWLPGVVRGVLPAFDHILAIDDEALRSFRRAGAPADRLLRCGRLEEPSHALPCTEAERAALARTFGTRPVWLATALPEAEEALVAEAHQAGARAAHRLLLIVVPDDPARGERLAARFEAIYGLSVARRGADQDPDEETQVYVADTDGEYGLWYRLAPLSYMGGTMALRGTAPAQPRHPFEAAALGSVVLHGPVTDPHAEAYARLDTAGACRPLVRPADLGEAVGDLLSPDRAARIARSAWDVTSAGAEATAEVLRRARGLLVRKGGP